MWSVKLYVDQDIIPVNASGWEDNIKKDLKYGKTWTGFIWLSIGTNGGLL